ncbi:hypothetical protein M9458_035726, partial [Cirrhinus mrigala]
AAAGISELHNCGFAGTGLQGYKLSYHEESEPEGPPIQIPPHQRQHTIGGLG